MHRMLQTAIFPTLLAAVLLIPTQASAQPDMRFEPPPIPSEVDTITFGSCFNTQGAGHVFDSMMVENPDIILMLGDNIYADTADPSTMWNIYKDLVNRSTFSDARRKVPVFAVWDDHDYGKNDAGQEWEAKSPAKDVFLRFFQEPPDSPRYDRDGIYHAKIIGPPGRRVQLLMLDTRWFRGPLERAEQTEPPARGRRGPYIPTQNEEATMLGEEQWEWLAEQLQQPVELRIVMSSIQFVADEHGFECWGNFPHERRRMLELIRETEAEGVLFVSGDRHHAELSVLDRNDPAAQESEPPYDIYDLTSSSLNAPIRDFRNEVNRSRVGRVYQGANFGSIRIDWDRDDPQITLRIHDEYAKTVMEHVLHLSDLSPKQDEEEHQDHQDP